MSSTKRAILSFVAVALFISPFVASADTLSDLQMKIQALLSQLSALQSQVQELQTTPAQTPVQIQAATPAAMIRCPLITRTLSYGVSGSDVSQLQTFLSQQGVYSDEVTGFFGVKTQAALQTWQAQQGIATTGTPATTGWGVLGPRSQSTLARLCPPTPQQDGSFSAIPSGGKAPLAVNFRVTVPTGGTGDTYMVDFGDGAHAVVQSTVACAAGTSFVAGNCPDIRGASHTYTTDGVYTASLYRQASNAGACAGNTVCGTLVTSTKITVSSTIACKIVDCAPGYHLEGASCSAEQRCVPNNASAPVINGVSGPSSLQVGETGTWTVQASIASGADTNLTYSVIWGDESILGQLNALAGASSATSATGSFTHAYGSAGLFTPTFAVSNTNGIAQASASVKVGTTNPISCPVYMLQACPAGYTNGPGRTNSDGCYQPGVCIPIGGTNSLTASPTSGTAPLSVLFSVYADAGSIEFGDGATQEINPFSIVTCAMVAGSWGECPRAFFNHTYTAPGTYIAQLRAKSAPNAAACYGVDCNTIGSATVTVGGSVPSSGGVTATAISGGPKVTISAPTVAQKMQNCTYSVGWFGSSGNGLTIDWGDGTFSPKNASSLQGTSCTNEVTSHTYTTNGTYTIKVRSWHPGPTDMAVNDWEGATTVNVQGATPIACPAIAYQIPLCSSGQHVEQTSSNGCPGAPICVSDSNVCPAVQYQTPLCPAGQHTEKIYKGGCLAGAQCVADTIYSQSTTENDSQLASALTALQGALAKLRGLFGN